ncbi:MAG: ATPase [Deltaproteobacteria bacterium]|nr:ATPase [Deltaproteobacteria bacterium]TLN03601.1 MAG: ATPase [bacterium]
MYESYFNLTSKPFELVPNPDFLFLSKAHRRARIYLDYGINERAGFILLTGEVGSGKTTLIRDLIKKQRPGVVLSKVFNTNVSFDQLLAMINDDFHLEVAGKDRITLLRDLNDFLIQQYALENRPTLIIDEAQNLTAGLLEDIRMLSNLETDDAKLLQIILVGQPELRKTLSQPDLLQLRQRISINCHISPLTREEVEEYILHRLEVAGNRQAIAFLPESLDIIYRYSRGIPRLVNIICDFLMLSAFAEEAQVLDEVITRDVIGDLDFENQFWQSGLPAAAEIPPVCSDSAVENGPQQQILEMLQGITARLDTLEKESSLFHETSLKDLGSKFTILGNAFRLYAGETDAVLSDLRDRLAKIADTKVSENPAGQDQESMLRRGQQVLMAALRAKN